jgi:hypothetical protein
MPMVELLAVPGSPASTADGGTGLGCGGWGAAPTGLALPCTASKRLARMLMRAELEDSPSLVWEGGKSLLSAKVCMEEPAASGMFDVLALLSMPPLLPVGGVGSNREGSGPVFCIVGKGVKCLGAALGETGIAGASGARQGS